MSGASAGTIRVYVIDDHAVLREGFALALEAEPGMTVVGHAGTGAEALKEVTSLKPDVILVDPNMPDRNGIEMLAALRVQVPTSRLLVLGCYDDELRVAEMLRAGAQGYLVKTSELAEVIDGIRCIARGGAPLSHRIAGAVVRAMRRPAPESTGGLDALTPRERQVLRLLAAGTSTRETAARLDLSPKAVETYRGRIYAKLGCQSTVELTRRWNRRYGGKPSAVAAMLVPARPPNRPLPPMADAVMPEEPPAPSVRWRRQ
jgi:DNA-binding NarL/FixJ family response regulator